MSKRILIPAVILLVLAGAAYLAFRNRDDAATTPGAATPPVAGDVRDPRASTASVPKSRVRTTSVALDFNGDRRSDWVVSREMGSGLTWFISSASGRSSAGWGTRGDEIVPADYDGDGKTDLAIWRAGTFYVRRSSDSRDMVRPWGQPGDDATIAGDYDGDGKADVAVYRPGAPSLWLIIKSTDGTPLQQAWGQRGDVAAPGDYDGDGRADFAVKRGASGSLTATFYLQYSSGGTQQIPWGLGTDLVVGGDYDGDGKTDLAVARQEEKTIRFFVRRSSDGATMDQPWGVRGDRLTPGDYDGDGKTDFAVWRPAPGAGSAFYVLRSSDGTQIIQPWGQSGDRPVATVGVH